MNVYRSFTTWHLAAEGVQEKDASTLRDYIINGVSFYSFYTKTDQLRSVRQFSEENIPTKRCQRTRNLNEAIFFIGMLF